MEIFKTEVLIVGGGGAGMRAALAAREEGAEVALVSKTPIGKSTCTQLSGGGFSVASPSFSREKHYEYSALAGKGLNQGEFLRALVAEAPECIRELEGFGLEGEWHPGRFNTNGKAPVWGNPIVEVLKKTAGERGVSLHPWIAIFELLQEEGKVIGALGFNFRTGKPAVFSARAVILASGGGGAIYPRNDNPVRATGDGYLLAYKAGCALRDMEFVQFIPIGVAEPGKPAYLLAPSFADAGTVFNSRGENILQKYSIFDKPVAVRCRDLFSRAIAFEERAGREVYLDLRSLSASTWPKDQMALSQRDVLERIYSCREKPLRISPTCHFFMGGIAASMDGETGVPGLFAVGEAVGGVHGANRMGGNALSEIMVFGRRAGRAAGSFVKKAAQDEKAAKRIEDYARETPGILRPSTAGTPPRELRRRVGRILWEDVGIVRNREGLSRALTAMEQIEKEALPAARRATPKEILETLELESILQTGEMIALSALRREESRGAHYREDFPETDESRWRGNIFLRNARGKMELEFRPLP